MWQNRWYESLPETINSSIFAASIKITLFVFGKIAPHYEVLPSLVVPDVLGRDYVVRPFTCGERSHYSAFASL